VFDKVTLHLDSRYYPDGDITITADRSNATGKYIKSVSLGGKKLNSFRISHKDLIKNKNLIMKY
jgi:putative alpha-1,2-mannosidase